MEKPYGSNQSEQLMDFTGMREDFQQDMANLIKDIKKSVHRSTFSADRPH